MFAINPLPYFTKKLTKLVRNNPKLKMKVLETVKLLSENPQEPILKSHKVGEYFSSRVTGDLRIIWDYNETKIQMLDLIDIGGHSGNKGVY